MNNDNENMRTDLLETREPFNAIFPIQDAVVRKITDRMKKIGFDPAHPITVWMTDKPVVLDGHTRLQVALSLGIEEVPVVLKEFSDIADALDYAVGQQIERRNITLAEMIRYIEVADQLAKRGRKKLEPDGSNLSGSTEPRGKSAERLAKTLQIPPKRAERLRRVVQDGSEETKQALCHGEISISKAYQDTLAEKAAKKKAAQSSSENPEESKITPEEQLRLARKLRLQSIPENLIAALEKEIKTEKELYPGLQYTEKQIASIREAVTSKLDSILNKLA